LIYYSKYVARDRVSRGGDISLQPDAVTDKP
jgi:hypothetical protein